MHLLHGVFFNEFVIQNIGYIKESGMRTSSSAVLSLVILVGLLIGFVVLFQLHLQLAALVDAHDISTNQLQDDVVSLQVQLAAVDKRFTRIEQAINAEENSKTSITPLSFYLPNQGVYVLPTEIFDEKSTTDRSLTIYHLSATVAVDDFSRQLHMGVATTGLMSVPQIYIDYDNDGRVDMDLVRKVAEPFFSFLPGAGWLLSDSIDPDASQEIYNAFMRDFGDAEFISLDNIAEDGGKMAQQLWQFIDNQSEELADWIRQKSDDMVTTDQ